MLRALLFTGGVFTLISLTASCLLLLFRLEGAESMRERQATVLPLVAGAVFLLFSYFML